LSKDDVVMAGLVEAIRAAMNRAAAITPGEGA
jgi:hypothetical protein